jgi:multidrug efflux pump subunit AcrA (membrane-fusion protein)
MTIRQLPYPFGSGQQEDEDNCEVRVAFDNANVVSELEPGNRVSMVAQLAVNEDVLWLPPAAIREFNGRSFVVVQDGLVQKRIDVSTGLRNKDRVEIESGVEEGQVVIGP